MKGGKLLFLAGLVAVSPILIGGGLILLAVFPYEMAGEKNPGWKKRVQKWTRRPPRKRTRK